MSIVGAQGVSMSELTGMGLDRLNAMAQGQQPSIAPSYLVLAAIEQLKKGKAGEQTPMPQGTVKDRLLASINQPSPMQAGIAQMAQPQQAQQLTQPVQKMAEGGSVEGSWVDRLPEGSGARMIRDYFANSRRKPILDALFDREEEPPALNVPKATMPTLAPMPIPDVQIEGGQKQAADAPNASGVSASISASARSRGVGSRGMSPLSKYNLDIPATPSEASYQLNIPKNQQLADAAAKYSSPDEARMAELRGAENRAGLGAFARGMVNPDRGRGFGAVFGSAAADMNDAREKRADMRREYEDRRQEMATKLSIMQGNDAREDFLKSSEWGAKRADEAWSRAVKKTELGIQGTHYSNQDSIERDKVGMMAEANRIAAEARRDGLTAAHHDRIQKLYLTAQEIAIKAAEMKYGKSDPIMAQSPEGAAREQAKQTLYEAEYAKAVQGLEARLGGEGNSRAAGTASIPVRKVYGP